MNACIITIGDELLQGFTRDTNSEWISKHLLDYDVHTEYKVTIPDDRPKIIQTLKRAISDQYDFIFITGGLGPTHDDVTRNALKLFFEVSTVFDQDHHEKLVEWCHQRNIIPPLNLESQSTILSGSTSIPNPVGSALGMSIKYDGSQIFILPGVPAEMVGMMQETILPKFFLKSDFSRFITLKTVGKGESKISEEISDIIHDFKTDVKIAFLPQYTGVNIRIKRISTRVGIAHTVANLIQKRLKGLIYTNEDQALEEVVGKMLRLNKLTLSVAESCTGGWLSKRLTDAPGSSDYFLGSVIAYHNNIKKSVLEIPDIILEQYGAVSGHTAKLMAESICKITGSSIGISTTGISGPTGGTLKKPVGLVFIGLAFNEQVFASQFNFLKNRTLHREMSCTTALNMLRLLLLENFSDTF